MTQPQSQTEHLSLVELLGHPPCREKPPTGWKHPRVLNIPQGTEVYVQSLRSRQWERGVVEDYWQRGAYLEVRCGQELRKVFAIETIATKELKLI